MYLQRAVGRCKTAAYLLKLPPGVAFLKSVGKDGFARYSLASPTP